MFIPTSSYRIQFNARFNFSHLAGIVNYLEDLGITAIYASPLLQPTRGSDHGYDGINPAALNPELGTIEELQALSELLKKKNIGWIQDIVPNHLAFNTSNIWLRDVFERGINSAYSNHFDIDWNHPYYGSKLMVPFLESPLDDALLNSKISIGFNEEGFFIAYYDNHYPVCIESYPFLLSGCFAEENNHVNAAISSLLTNQQAPVDHWHLMKKSLLKLLADEHTSQKIAEKLAAINEDVAAIKSVLTSQHYVLCYFADSHTQINYRRFFNVNGLICLRMEDEKVFHDYHHFTHELYEKGIIQGFRIDHIDGLKNPTEYIARMRALFGKDCYIIVEKILDQKEKLPGNMDIEGTSGYEFLSYINQLLTDNKGAEKLLSIYNTYVPEHNNYERMVFDNKLSNLESYLNGEWDNLLRMLVTLNLVEDEEVRMQNLKKALGLFMAAYPVYRAYIDALPLTENDEQLVALAFEKAIARDPSLHYEFSILREVFLPHPDQTTHSNRLLFVQRLMQFTGPLAAKGVEDTTFYQYNPLISHNEVGDQPCVLGIPVQHFHEKMQERQQLNPYSFNCTSTHDTKRGEDGRIRINIISELADEWKVLVKQWQEINEPYRRQLGDVRAPIVNDEYFLYQAIVGGFPEDLQLTDEFVERTKRYFNKALRESKHMSDYVNPNIAYEEACTAFIDHLLNPGHKFLPSLIPFVKKIIRYANTYTMIQVIIKTTAPGIPDIYRGCELWDISYVDPDNRRPVDYVLRKKMLHELRQKQQEDPMAALEWAAEHYELGAQKLMVTTELLRLRKQYPELFIKGDYVPVYAEDSRMLIAYCRCRGAQWVLVVLPLGIVANETPKGQLELPENAPREWKNLFTGKTITTNRLSPDNLFTDFPLAVLISA